MYHDAVLDIFTRMMSLGNRVKELREQSGLSQTELASRSAITQRTLSNIERDVGDAKLNSIVNLAGTFKCDLRWLATGEAIPETDRKGNRPMINDNFPKLRSQRLVDVFNTKPVENESDYFSLYLDDIVDTVPKPLPLADHPMFCMLVANENMSPRFDRGDVVFVSWRQRQLLPGMDVLIEERLPNQNRMFYMLKTVGDYDRNSGLIEFKQFREPVAMQRQISEINRILPLVSHNEIVGLASA